MNTFTVVFTKQPTHLLYYLSNNRLLYASKIFINSIIKDYKLDPVLITDDEQILINTNVWNRLTWIKSKKKDIYYTPNFKNPKLTIAGLAELKQVADSIHYNLQILVLDKSLTKQAEQLKKLLNLN